MTLRSMTGFAQVKGQVHAQMAFALSLKSVNHRFLDLHFLSLIHISAAAAAARHAETGAGRTPGSAAEALPDGWRFFPGATLVRFPFLES